VAHCFASDDGLQALMVSAGWAWSFGRYSKWYAPEQKEAEARKSGCMGIDVCRPRRCLPP